MQICKYLIPTNFHYEINQVGLVGLFIMRNPNVFIDGSRGGAKILDFCAVFGKIGQTVGWCPSLRVGTPFWEIQDLLLVFKRVERR